MQKPSDVVRKEAVEPLSREVVIAARNKQAVNPAERDLVTLAGTITNAAGESYTRDNLIKATDAIHQGETEANETACNYPVNVDDVMAAVGNADSFNLGYTMANINSTAHKGFEKSLREILLSLQEVRLMGNKLIDPDGKYLDSQGLQQWLDKEKKHLKTIELPELMDFTKLDWKKDPDKFIELGGRYFRESFLGTHLFGYGVEAIKGPGGSGVSPFFGTVVGVARFYNKSDDMVGSILGGGALASADIGWDQYVNMLSQHLPGLSRQALLFANSVMSKEMKAQMFERMTKDFRMKEAQRRSDPSSSEGFTVTISPSKK